MIVGTVREIKKQEYRVGLTPDNAAEYVRNGHKVYVEANAGAGSGFTDAEYQARGAEILAAAADVYSSCYMVVKVKEPLEEEFAYLRKDLILYTYLHLAANRPLTEALLGSGTKAVAFETIRDRSGALPCLKPMSEIAGRLSIQEGAKYLETPFGGRGVLLGGVPGVEKGKIAIVGGGVAGTNAAKMAVGIGAQVTIIDISLSRLEYLDDIFGGRITTLFSTDSNIERSIAEADLVIGSVLIPGASTPKLIKRPYLDGMKPGSVIVDIAIDQGGCCETSHVTYHDDPTYKIDGVVHYCVGNMPGAVPRTSTIALANTTIGYGLRIAGLGLEAACAADPNFARGLNTYAGECTNKEVAESLCLRYAGMFGTKTL